MASNGQQAFAPVLEALSTMQSNVDRAQKSQAHEYLEKFQKSPEAWTTTYDMLSSATASTEAKLFAATTLKGKITYDFDQLPRQSLPALRDSLLSLLTSFRGGPRPIRTQLCVCLVKLAIYMTEWKDVLPVVGLRLGTQAGDCVLEFLKVLPEEVNEGRKINLSEDELSSRTVELLHDNSAQVMHLLIQYSQSSPSAASSSQILECISSWLSEVPVADVVKSPLFDVIINALSNDMSFEAAVDCMCNIIKQTSDVDASLEVIQILYPRILALQPRVAQAADADDQDTFKGLTRIFADAGVKWVVMIGRLPHDFRGLVEVILECCARDKDRDAIAVTFYFWRKLRLQVISDRFIEARNIYADVISKLVDIMIKHLEFPTPEGPDESDLFDGDREQEERFRDFRHHMGDVLKDCCGIITATECLSKVFNLMRQWVSQWGSQATDTKVPHWQELEACLFSFRAMGGMVSPEENVATQQIIPLLVQIPNHDKLQFQAIMAISRYTEWTAQHPEFLQPQLNFVIAGFNHSSKEVVRSAATAFQWFGIECKKLLADHVQQLHGFYLSVIDKLSQASQEEVVTGLAHVISVQPLDRIYPMFKLFCDPIIKRTMSLATGAKSQQGEAEKSRLAVADSLQLVTIYVQEISPYVSPGKENPAVTYCQEILPVMSTIAENFTDSLPILETVCRCWRNMVGSYRTAILPLLSTLAQQLASGFQNTRQGCFLWATDAVLREFAVGAEFVDPSTSQAIYSFFETQAVAFLRIMNDLPPDDLPDVIEDFFRLLVDALIYYHQQLLASSICEPILSAAISTLTLQQFAPLEATLHFLRDFLSYGTDNPNSSRLNDGDRDSHPRNPLQIQQLVKQFVRSQGEVLVQRSLTGMMFHFPRDCFADASGVVLALFEIMPQETAIWVKGTVGMLPAGSVKADEADRLMSGIGQHIQSGDVRKVRALLQDFANSYRRRNVAPREGLGRLEATRFRFSG